MEAISAAKIGPEEVAKSSGMASGMRVEKHCVGSAFGWRGQGVNLFAAAGRARTKRSICFKVR